MTTITDRFEEITSLPLLANFLDGNLETKISFWGQRLVTSYDYEGSIPLKQISQFANELIKRRTSFHSPQDIQSSWNQYINPIIRKIDLLYKTSNEQIEKCNRLTLKFIALRNCCGQPEDIEWENTKLSSPQGLKFAIPRWKRYNGTSHFIN